jgi:uncharacterized protein (TIGR02246 family)
MSRHTFAAILVSSIYLFGPFETAPAQASRHGADEAPIAAGLQSLQDREQIRLLLIDYGKHFDSRNFSAYSNLFTDDGVWIGSGNDTEFVGPSAIRAMVEEGFPPTVFPGSFHIMTSISVELTGADSATAWSRWTFMVRDEGGTPMPFRAGHYEDVLVRDAGEWKFQRRQVFSE